MIIRKCEIEDAEKMLEMALALDKETKYMLLEPGERRTDVRGMEMIIRDIEASGSLQLVASYENEIIGFLTAKKNRLRKIKHSVHIGIGIREKYRNKGIGSKLFKELDNWAMENNIKRLELTVVCENIVARRLYEKNGFEVEGIKRESIYMDGKYFDEYYMGKLME